MGVAPGADGERFDARSGGALRWDVVIEPLRLRERPQAPEHRNPPQDPNSDCCECRKSDPPSSLLTVPACAAAIRSDVRASTASTADTLRYIRETISNAAFVAERDLDRAAFFAEPSTTGDRRWDALLAGVVDYLANNYGFDRPGWTSDRFVTPFWFVGSTPALHAYAYAHSPAPLAYRGVFIDPADLESV